GAAAPAGTAGPAPGHGLAVAGHRRIQPGLGSAADPLPGRSRSPRPAGEAGPRSRAQAAAMVSILVTGGAGYIGSHMTRMLAASGLQPVVVDDLSSGRRQAVRGTPLHVG